MKNPSPPFQFQTSPKNSISDPKPNGHKKMIQCPFDGCGKVFRYKSEKDRHMISHSGFKAHICPHPLCNKSFKRLDALKVHMQTHSGKPQFFCPVPGCSTEFKDASALKYHLRRHHSPSEAKLATKNQPRFRAKSYQIQRQLASNLINDINQTTNSFDFKILKDDEIPVMTKNTGAISREDWSPGLFKILYTEEQKSSFKRLEDTEQKNYENFVISEADLLEQLHNKLQRENEQLRKKLADQMTSFSSNKILDSDEQI